MVKRKTVLGTIVILTALIFGGCSSDSDVLDHCYEITVVSISDVGATGVVTRVPAGAETPRVNDEITFDLMNINLRNVKLGDKISIRIIKNHGGFTAHPEGIWTLTYFCEIEPC